MHFRQIPSAKDIPENDKRELWWSCEDLQGFAREELNRLMSEGNINVSDASGSLESGTPPTSTLLLPPAKSIEVAQPSLSPAQHGTVEAQFCATTPDDVPPLADTEEPWDAPSSLSSSPFGGVLSAIAGCTISDEPPTVRLGNSGSEKSPAPDARQSEQQLDERRGDALPPPPWSPSSSGPPELGTLFQMDVDEAKATNAEGVKRAARKDSGAASSSDDEDPGYAPGQPVTPPTPPTPDYIRKTNREIHDVQLVRSYSLPQLSIIEGAFIPQGSFV